MPDLDEDTLTAGESPIILEVKWDDFLPDIIKDAVSIPGRCAIAFQNMNSAVYTAKYKIKE